jgi:hypothetical protein
VRIAYQLPLGASHEQQNAARPFLGRDTLNVARCLQSVWWWRGDITAVSSRPNRLSYHVPMYPAVCRPGVEPLAGFTKQNVRKCRPGFAKRGNGNFK